MNKSIEKRIRGLKSRISEYRIIKSKRGNYICKFCKNHPEDCFCNDNSRLELKGINFVLKELTQKTGREE